MPLEHVLKEIELNFLNFTNARSIAFSLFCSILGGALIALSGCGKDQPAAQDNSRAQASFDQGKSYIAEEKWEEALVELEAAEKAGVIGPDQMGELVLFKALSLAHLGRFDESKQQLELAEQGADPDMIADFKSKIDEIARPGK